MRQLPFLSALLWVVLLLSVCAGEASADWVTRNVTCGGLPRAMALDPLTNKVYVAQEDSASIVVFEPLSGSIKRINVQLAPDAMGINPRTRKLFVANQQSHSVSVIDMDHDLNVATVQVGNDPYAIAVNPVTNKVYVTNQTSNTVTVIDGTSYATSLPISTGASPQAVAVNPVTNKIYVANHGSNNVTEIDGVTNTPTNLTAGSLPNAVVVNPVTNFVYVANSGSNSVSRIHGVTHATVSIGVGAQPYALGLDPVANKIYVCNVAGSSVTIIEGATNATTTRAVGVNPVCVAVNSLTRRAYVSCLSGTALSILDGNTNTIAQNLTIGDRCLATAINPWTQRVYAARNIGSGAGLVEIDATVNAPSTAAAGSGQTTALVHRRLHRGYILNGGAGTVTEMDLTTMTPTATISVGSQPTAGVVDELRDRLYVANAGAGTVSVIDVNTRAVTPVPVGTTPRAVALAQRSNRVFVANAGSGNVTVIDGQSLVTRTVPVGARPWALAVQPKTEACYVANRGSNTVSRLDGYGLLTHTRCVGTGPAAVAVDPVRSRVFVANSGASTVSVLEGNADRPRTVSVGSGPMALAVDVVSGRVFTADSTGSTVTVIRETDFTTTTLPVGARPSSLALSAWSRRLYVGSLGGSTATLIDLNALSSTGLALASPSCGVAVDDVLGRGVFAFTGTTLSGFLTEAVRYAQPLTATLDPIPDGTATYPTVGVSGTATSTRAGINVLGAYLVTDTPAQPWKPTGISSGGGTQSIGWNDPDYPASTLGTHLLGVAALDGTSGTLDNSSQAGAVAFVGGMATIAFQTIPNAISVQIPSSDDLWNADDLSTVRVAWGPGPANASTVDLEYRESPNSSWVSLATGVPAEDGVWMAGTPLPRADAGAASVRATLFDAGHAQLAQQSSSGFALGQEGYVRLRAQTGPDTFTEPPVIFWDWCGDVNSFNLSIETTTPTTCDFTTRTIENIAAYRRWAQIDPDVWAGMPAGRYEIRMTANQPGGWQSSPELVMTIVKFQLSDQDPGDTDNKNPVILVHGWTSDGGTWFKCGESPFIQALIHGPNVGQSFHPWTFEYPNVDAVRHSAAGLAAAVTWLRGRSANKPVRMVAHSMGGLVSRAYLQGEAVDPQDDFATGPRLDAPPAGWVTHLATLSTPNLGVSGYSVNTATDFKSLGSCVGAVGSQSVEDLKDTSALIAELNAPTQTMPNIYYFLAGGFDAEAEGFGGGSRGKALGPTCDWGNDATVDVCSARGDCFNHLHPTALPPFADLGKVIRAQYSLSHSMMSLPGVTQQCDDGRFDKDLPEPRKTDSAKLLDNILGFLRELPPPSTTCAGAELKPTQITSREGEIVTADFAPQKAGRNVEAFGDPLEHAFVWLRPVAAQDSLAGFFGTTDASGSASVGLIPGQYVLDVLATGHSARRETLTVAPSAHDLRISLDLPAVGSWAGPTGPSIAIDGGAPSTSSGSLTVSLGCAGATEYQLAIDAVFLGATWQSMTSTVPFPLPFGPGPYQLFARYRDALGRETTPVSASIEYLGGLAATVSVTSTGAAGSILVDDRPTGFTTPATVGPLGPGSHVVSVVADGFITDPPSRVVFLAAGGTDNAVFTLAPSAQPGDAAWLEPANRGAVRTGGPIGWSRSTDADPGDVALYDLAFYRDAQLSDRAWSVSGVAETTLVLPAALHDSTSYFVTLRAWDGHRTSQSGSDAVREIRCDRTPPAGQVVFPKRGSLVSAAALPPLRFEVRDWSGMASALVLLSIDGGATYPDTVYSGAYSDSLPWTPPAIRAEHCKLRLVAADSAGNVTMIPSDSLFMLFGDVTVAQDAVPLELALRVQPVPARSGAHVRFDLPRATPVRVEIFDVAGRSVRLLVAGSYPAGSYSQPWDLRDGEGRRLSTGVYFLRMRAGEGNRLSRVVIVQ